MSAILNLCPPLAFSYSLMHVQNPPHCMLGIHDQYLRMIYLYRWMSGPDDTLVLHQFFTHKWPFLVVRKCPKCIQFDSPGQACSQACPRGGSSSAFRCTSAWAALCQLAGSTQGGMGERWINDEFFDFSRCYLFGGEVFFLPGRTPRDLIKRRE